MKLRYFPLLALLLAGCSQADKAGTAATSPDTRFDAYKNQFIEALWRQYPDYGAAQGYHKYDSLLVIPDATQRQRDAAFAQQYLVGLGRFALDSLSPGNQIDLRLLRNELRGQRWYADTLKSWQWDPSRYNLGAAVGDLLS
ncbi:MAG TPA: DUF885 domain-containing protein, partial [Hymenobacter sp.]